jgi:hypothetical protein
MAEVPVPTFTALAILSLVLSAWPGTAAGQQPSAPAGYPIPVQLATVVDHTRELSRKLVQLPTSRITRVISPSVVEVTDAREHSRWHFLVLEPDHLFVLLPTGARVAAGQDIVVSGLVRTVRGARITGDLPAGTDDLVKHHGNAAMLVALRAATPDGADLGTIH